LADIQKSSLVRTVAYIEAISYLFLIAGLIWRAAFNGPDLSAGLGLTHGIIYLVYVALILASRADYGWPWAVTLELLAAGVVPFGGFYVAQRYLSVNPQNSP
jgi:integral membrane protein